MNLTYRLVGLLLAAILIAACGASATTPTEGTPAPEEGQSEEGQGEEGATDEASQEEGAAAQTPEATPAEGEASSDTAAGPQLPDEERPTLGDEVVETDSGLQYEDVETGEGDEAAAGDLVKVHYTGWLEDGTVFDSSKGRGATFDFVLGKGQVIPGWDEGVQGMQPGGKRVLVIPPDLGYGEQGAGGTIPPNATLTFEVELVEVEPAPKPTTVDQYEKTESGLEYAIVKEGSGPEAKEGNLVKVHYSGWLEDGTLFDSSEQQGGEPIPWQIGGLGVEGLNEGLVGMKQGERRQLRIPPELAFGEEGAGNGVIPPNATVTMEVEVHEIVELPERSEVSEDEYETTESGVQYAVVEEGEGEAAKSGDEVSVHYTGWIDDEKGGTFFHSTHVEGQPLTLKLGEQFMIPGLAEGVEGMKPGEKRQLRVPPELVSGGGEGARSPFPPDTTLIFDVELLEIK